MLCNFPPCLEPQRVTPPRILAPTHGARAGFRRCCLSAGLSPLPPSFPHPPRCWSLSSKQRRRRPPRRFPHPTTFTGHGTYSAPPWRWHSRRRGRRRGLAACVFPSCPPPHPSPRRDRYSLCRVKAPLPPPAFITPRPLPRDRTRLVRRGRAGGAAGRPLHPYAPRSSPPASGGLFAVAAAAAVSPAIADAGHRACRGVVCGRSAGSGVRAGFATLPPLSRPFPVRGSSR